MEVALTLHRMRHYAEVEQFYDRAIALSPDWGEPYRLKIRMYLAWYGNTDRAWEIIKETPLELSPMFVGWHPLWYNLYVLDKNYDMAITEMKKTRSKQGRIGHPFYYTALAAIYEFADDVELVKVYYDSAKYAINFFPVNDKKDAAHTYALLGFVHAGLGEKDEAIRLGKKAIEMIPLSDDSHYWGTYLLEYLAWIYTMVGEHDLAVDQLEKLLSAPGYISVRLIRSHPMWKPLQNHPRFKALVETNFM